MDAKTWMANHLSEVHAMGVRDDQWEQANLDVFHSYFHARAEGMPDFDAGRDLETGVVLTVGRCGVCGTARVSGDVPCYHCGDGVFRETR